MPDTDWTTFGCINDAILFYNFQKYRSWKALAPRVEIYKFYDPEIRAHLTTMRCVKVKDPPVNLIPYP